MSLPSQAPPVRRPQLVEPHLAVEVRRGTAHQLLRVRMYLLHAANHNDPAPYAPRSPERMMVSALRSPLR